MKKLLYILLLLGFAISSCNKPVDIPTEKVVVFQASMGGSNFKDGDTPAFDCTTEGATYAIIEINHEEQTVNLIRDEYGAVYTESIKLPASVDGATTYSLDSFILYNDEGEEVLAIPLIDSEYAKYVTNPLPMDFDVEAFYKNEVPIQVLCFDETVITQFGFSWFSLDVTAIREICFFGDICVDANDYVGSLYEDQRNGLQHDMPAIFEIKVSTWNKTTNDWNVPEVIKNNETLEGSSTDAYDWLGEGAALCVQFPDYAGVDTYKIELLVYVSDGIGGFNYQTYQTWNFDDNNFPVDDIDADGVIDFVIGNCVPGADIIIPPTDPDPTECGECGDHNGEKIQQLTLRYKGSVSNPHIIVTDDSKDGGVILYEGNPDLTDGVFSFTGQKNGGELGAKIYLYVNDSPRYEIHTSCSVPLYVEQDWGDFKIVSGTLLSGLTLCGSNPNPDPTECGECDGKISQLTLRYVGDISNPHIKVTDDSKDGGVILYEGDPTDTFSFIGQKDKGDMGVKIFLYVNDDPRYEIHTSCSVDIYAGQTWGDYYIVSGESVNGGSLCSI
ncbi:MAG: hypothetical protein J7J72_00005 [Bacteroidales bacterium]|nr:hypothetical protein [Bacteroidales bacterium]